MEKHRNRVPLAKIPHSKNELGQKSVKYSDGQNSVAEYQLTLV